MADSPLHPRQHPISPPSNARQFRAIGLVYGRYYASGESSQRGIIVTPNGSIVESVLLGKTFSLFKRHIALEEDHFWIVYPRQRDKDDHLHFQLAGLWEPDKLGAGLTSAPEPSALPAPDPEQPYFSVRGEVVFVSQARETIVVKVRQAPKPPSRRPMFFKVKVQGVLLNAGGEVHDRPLRHFWDIEATLEKDQLVLVQATDLGPMQRRSGAHGKPAVKPSKKPKLKTSSDSPRRKGSPPPPKLSAGKRRLF